MKYAIVESGGKQYKAVEGDAIEVDRLPGQPGDELSLERVLMLVDGESVNVGQPTVGGMAVQVTIDKHFRGDKVLAFRYSPKKRIRVRRGQRHEYTRLMVDVIGEAGAPRPASPKKARKAAPAPEVEEEADDLAMIEGVGPKAAKVLNEAGILTFAQLAESSVEDLHQILSDAGLKSMNPDTWAEQAKLAADGNWKALEKLQAKLVGGRKAAPAKKK
ncbi:MAG: 50S ribosomal protein L21 [Chloroflexota bacterium]